MTDLPRHPEASNAPDAAPGGSTKKPWVAYGVGLVLAVLLLIVIALHLTGAVGPGAH